MTEGKGTKHQLIFKLMCVLFVFAAIAGAANVAVILANTYGSELVQNVLVYASWGFVIGGMLLAGWIYLNKNK